MRVVVLGAGFGGLELASTLARRLGDRVQTVLVDRAEGFVFGFSKLDVMFGRTDVARVTHRYADLAHPGVRLLRTEVRAIDPVRRRVSTDAGDLEADLLVVALGADLDPAATPGLVEGGQEFYTMEGALAARDRLAAFRGGRVLVGVCGTPFKCPPAPSETALLTHQYLEAHGLLEHSTVTLVSPLPTPVPPAPDASAAILLAFEKRGIGWLPGRVITRLDPGRGVAVTVAGEEIGYDLFLGVPKHRVPVVVATSGLAVDGWVPVDPATLATAYPGVYAVGDVTSVGTPKAGMFAEGQGAVVAAHVAATVLGADPPPPYDGRATCFVEMGEEGVAKVDVRFVPGSAPAGVLTGPDPALAEDKTAFAAERVRRWFGHAWSDR